MTTTGSGRHRHHHALQGGNLPAMLLLALAGALAGCASQAAPATQPSHAAAEVRPSPIQFGVFGPEGFRETSTVTLVPGTAYGWRVPAMSSRRLYNWREEMTLPASAHWGVSSATAPQPGQVGEVNHPGDQTKVDESGTDARTSGTSRPKGGWVDHQWRVINGDPAGEYIVRVEFEGLPPATFRVLFVQP